MKLSLNFFIAPDSVSSSFSISPEFFKLERIENETRIH